MFISTLELTKALKQANLLLFHRVEPPEGPQRGRHGGRHEDGREDYTIS